MERLNQINHQPEGEIRKSLALQARWQVWKYHMLQEAKEILGNNQGMGIVEIALIIMVIVALAFLFKDKATKLIQSIFDGIDADGLGQKIH